MSKIDALTRVYLEQEKWYWNTSWWWINNAISETTDDFSKLLDEKWDNYFSLAFQEIYNEFTEKQSENNVWDDFKDRVNKAKEKWKIKLKTTFERLIKWEEIQDKNNLTILEKLFRNKDFLKIFREYVKENSKITDKMKEELSVKKISRLIKEKIDESKCVSKLSWNSSYRIFLSEKGNYDIENMDTWKIYENIALKWCSKDFKIKNVWWEDCIITETQVFPLKKDSNNNSLLTFPKNIFHIFNWYIYTTNWETYPIQELNKNYCIKFDNISVDDWKIIMYNNWWNFIVFDEKTENIIYESKKWDSFVEITKEHKKVKYTNFIDQNVEFDIDLGEEKIEYKKIRKTFFWIWKLIIPTHFIANNDYDWFLRSPYLKELLKLWNDWNNIFDIINELIDLKKVLLETIEKNFDFLRTDIKFEKGIHWWTFFNWLEKYIEENYEKYEIINWLNSWRFYLNREKYSKHLKWLMSWEWSGKNYLKLGLNKFIEIDSERSMTEKWSPNLPVKIWEYILWKEILSWDEYLVKLDKEWNILHVIKKHYNIRYSEWKDWKLMQEKIILDEDDIDWVSESW